MKLFKMNHTELRTHYGVGIKNQWCQSSQINLLGPPLRSLVYLTASPYRVIKAVRKDFLLSYCVYCHTVNQLKLKGHPHENQNSKNNVKWNHTKTEPQQYFYILKYKIYINATFILNKNEHRKISSITTNYRINSQTHARTK